MNTKRRFLVYIFLLLALCACNKPGSNEQQPYSASDSLLIHALQSIFNPSLSCLDAKDEIMMLLDTMQSHVESCPDEQIRIGARAGAFAFRYATVHLQRTGDTMARTTI